jgi:hypothetical protein
MLKRSKTLTIRGGRVVDPANGVDAVADLHIAGPRILALGDAPRISRPNASLTPTDSSSAQVWSTCARACASRGCEQKATIASETRPPPPPASPRCAVRRTRCPGRHPRRGAVDQAHRR